MVGSSLLVGWIMERSRIKEVGNPNSKALKRGGRLVYYE